MLVLLNLALLVAPALAGSLPPSSMTATATLSPLQVTGGTVTTRLTLTARCSWNYTGRWVHATAEAACVSVEDLGSLVSLNIAPPSRIRLGMLPVVGPYAGGATWAPDVTLESDVGAWRWNDGWELDPVSVLPNALDALLRQPTGSPNVELVVRPHLGAVPANVQTRVESGTQRATFSARDLLALGCGSAGPDAPVWQAVGRHAAVSLAGVTALKAACPGASPERVLCEPLSSAPFALTGAAYGMRLGECAQLTKGDVKATEAAWAPVVQGALAHAGRVPGEDLVTLLGTMEADGAPEAATRLRAALASPWTEATSLKPMEGVDANDVQHPVVAAILGSKNTPAPMRIALERRVVTVLQAEADAIGFASGGSIDEGLRALARLQARGRIAGLSAASARAVQMAAEGAAKRVSEALAGRWFGLSWSGGNEAAMRTLAEARRVAGASVVDAAMRAAAARTDTASGNAFDGLFALAAEPGWARDRVAIHLAARLTQANAAGRAALEREFSGVQKRYADAGRPVPDVLTRHPAVASLQAQKAAEEAAARAKVEAEARARIAQRGTNAALEAKRGFQDVRLGMKVEHVQDCERVNVLRAPKAEMVVGGRQFLVNSRDPGVLLLETSENLWACQKVSVRTTSASQGSRTGSGASTLREARRASKSEQLPPLFSSVGGSWITRAALLLSDDDHVVGIHISTRPSADIVKAFELAYGTPKKAGGSYGMANDGYCLDCIYTWSSASVSLTAEANAGDREWDTKQMELVRPRESWTIRLFDQELVDAVDANAKQKQDAMERRLLEGL